MKIVENKTVNLPDGSVIKSFWITKNSGARVGKVSGDLNKETWESIFVKALRIVRGGESSSKNPLI